MWLYWFCKRPKYGMKILFSEEIEKLLERENQEMELE